MSHHLYFPQDLLNRKSWYRDSKHLALGLRKGNTYVVITTVKYDPETVARLKHVSLDHGLQVVATVNVVLGDLPVLRISANKYPDVEAPSSFNLICFTPPYPNSMEYFAIEPIYLKSKATDPQEWYVNKLKLHCDLHHSSHETLLPQIIHYINNCVQLREYLYIVACENTGLFQFPPTSMPALQSLQKHAFGFITYIILQLKSAGGFLLSPILHVVLDIIGYAIFVLNYRIYAPSLTQQEKKSVFTVSSMGIQQAPQTRKVADTTKPADGKVALVDVSLFLKQLSVRLTQLYNLPRQYRNTKLSIHGTASQPIDLQRLDQFDFQNSNYITFYNTLWLVLNDLFLGLSVSNLLRHYETEIQTFITKRMIQEVLIDRLGQLIDWLMDNPAGFKLNDELTSFIGELFLWTVRFWTVLLEAVVLRYIQLWIKIIPYVTAFGGLSFAIGMVMDLVQLITFHTFCFQFSAARLYHWQISILRSLFKLIVGKRINVLRDNRTDKVDFSFDQLLLGTVLFMVLVYLVPTVFAFYLPFTLMRKGIQGVRWGCDRIIHWLNYFPLFVVLLKIKNNRRLPGGLRFELQEVYPTTVFKMSNESVSFATIFK